jgi:hypothetical protein
MWRVRRRGHLGSFVSEVVRVVSTRIRRGNDDAYSDLVVDCRLVVLADNADTEFL